MRFFYPQRLRPLFLLTGLLFAVQPVFAQAPTWQWAESPGPGISAGSAVDSAGNIYVTGAFSGTATFGTTTLTSVGADDIFVAKRTPTGTWQWAISVGGSGSDEGSDVAVDGNGNVVVTGYFASPALAFGTTPVFNAGAEDVFIAKLSPSGAWQWAQSMGGREFDCGNEVAVDGNDNVVVTGVFASPTLAYGSTRLTNAGDMDFFVAKLTPAGAWQWAVSAGGSNDDYVNGMAVDDRGNVVVTGDFNNPTLSFGATTLTNAGSNDVFVAQLTPAGIWQWATGVGGPSDDRGSGVAVDGSGNVVVTGQFRGTTLAFGSITLTNAGNDDVFVAKLTPTGIWQWATSAGGSGFDYGPCAAVDGRGNVIVTGSFGSPSIAFGATTLTNAGSNDVFVAQLTPAGIWQWATGASGSYNDQVSGVVDGNGHVVITGFFDSPTITFGTTTLTNTMGNSTIFLARLNTVTGLPEDPSQPAFTLAPNPARTTVQLTGTAGATATLLDGLGRVVGTALISPAGNATMDIQALPAGLYLVRVGGSKARRLVVE